MNWDQIEGDWKRLRGKVRERWGELTDDDLDVIRGKRDRLVGAVQKRYGVAKEEAARTVEEWRKKLRLD